MVSGYEHQFTAAGAEIAEETQRVNQNLRSPSAFAQRSLRLCGESALFTGVLKALIAHNFNLHTLHLIGIWSESKQAMSPMLCASN